MIIPTLGSTKARLKRFLERIPTEIIQIQGEDHLDLYTIWFVHTVWSTV
jgi:hypothetical protein